MSYNVIKIAEKILAKGTLDAESGGDLICNLKLQKILYYMQGYYIAYFNKPLFNEEIEAWMYGPVVPSVYEKFKEYSSRGIEFSEEVIHLNIKEEELFEAVYDEYKKYSAIGLMNMTHNETPWKTTQTGSGNIITKEKLKSFFKIKLKNG